MKQSILYLLSSILVASLLTGCAYDSYHHRDGTTKRPLQDDSGNTNQAPNELPQLKGQP